MKFTKEVVLATEILSRVPEEPIPARKLAAVLGTTEFFLQRIVGKLRKADLVKVKKGPEGGVFLNPNIGRPTVLDVYRALGRPETDMEKGTFLAGVRTNILDLLGNTTIPHAGLETEDGQERGGE